VAAVIFYARCFRPNTGLSSFDEEKSDLLQKYRKISPEEAGKSTAVFFV